MNGSEYDAELEVLGSCMASPDAAAEAAVLLTVEDFARESHRAMFAAICRLVAEGMDTGPVALSAELGSKPVRLLDIADRARPHAIVTTCGIVRREAATRRADAALRNALTSLRDGEAASDVLHALATLPEVRSVVATVADMCEVLTGEWTQKRETVSLSEWGKRARFGELFLIGARPGVGKSALASQFAVEWAARHLRVRLYSYEMRPSDWLERLAAHTTGVGLERIEDGLDADYLAAVRKGLTGEWARFLEVVDCSRMTFDALLADMRAFSRHGGRVVIVDYLQLAVEQTYEDVTAASRRLKLAALAADLLVVAVSQLSRRPARDDGSTRAPSLSDLRQSGALEQDADTVMLLHTYEADDTKVREAWRRDGYALTYDTPPTPEAPWAIYKRLGHVEFAKVRRGVRERIPAWFDGSEMRWTPVDRMGGAL